MSRLGLDDLTFITNGGTLTIEALEIVSNNGGIRSFEHPEQPGDMHDGRSGRKVTLSIYRNVSGLLTINLSGGAGASGRDGLPGNPGSQGPEGEHSASGAFDCSHGPGRGGNGSPGQPGFPGEAGGNGGDGGRLYLLVMGQSFVRDHIIFSADGGAPGSGGRGGRGGPGGPGGNGGASGGWCQGRGRGATKVQMAQTVLPVRAAVGVPTDD